MTPADEIAMNRLLSVFSQRIDALRPLLASPEHAVRRDAVAQLAHLAPMSDPQLESLLSDADPAVRIAAARAVAAGEGKSIREAARARLSRDPAVARMWIDFVAR